MQEDIKVVVTADTATAEKQIDKLNNEKIKIETEIKVLKNPLKEVREEADIIGKKVNEIKINKKAFSPEDIKILKAEIEAAALKAKAIYFGEGNRSAKELADRLKEMHKSLAESKNQSKETNKIFGNMDIMIGSLKAKIVANIVNTLKQGVTEGAKLAGQLESAAEKIKTISGENRGILNNEVDRIGKKYGVDYKEVSEGLYQVVSAIGDVHKKYALLETSNKLAITGFSSINQSVDGLTTVLNAYKLGIEEADRVANVFVRTQKVGKLTVQEFQQQLYKTVPTAKELGISIEEIGASIALLTAKGSKAEVAQTQMGAFMYELLDTGSEVNKLFTKLKGQSIETYMNSGGNLEGILKTLKNYSNQSGFKIESLFGRKEAKSYWLNLGNDINGYIEKLKAINSPVNELDRNVDNLMATMEKRIDRGAKYWDSLKSKVMETGLEILASIGDITTGHNKEAAARKKLNAEMEENLKTLDELGKKNDLTKDEQEKLNESLNTLRLMSPDISRAFEDWKNGLIDYAKYAEIAKQKTDELNASNLVLSMETNSKEQGDVKKQLKSLYKDIEKFEHEYRYKGESKQDFVKRLSKNPNFSTKILEYQKNILLEQKLRNDLKGLRDTGTELESKINNTFDSKREAEKTVLNEDTQGGTVRKRTLSDMKTFKSEQEIENDTSKLLIEAQRKYKEKLEKLAITDFTGKEKLDSSYKNEVEGIKNKGQVEQYKRERNDLERGILTETDDTKVKEAQDKIEKTSLKIQMLEGQIGIDDKENKIDNAKKTEEERKKAEEKEKTEIAKRNKDEQLKIDTDYNNKMLKATTEYNKAMAALKENGTKEEIEAVKKAYEEAKREAETEKKIETLKNKKENTYYSTVKEKEANTEAIVAEISLTEANAEKEKADKDAKDAQDKNTEALNRMSTNLRNLAGLFQAIGDNTSSTAIKNIANGLNIGSTIFDTLKGTEQGKKLIGDVLGSGAIPGFENFSMGAGIGGAISGALGGGAEGNIGSAVGALAGTFIPIPGVGQAAGSIIGGALGSIGGSLFGRSKKKKAKREARKRKAAQERLQKGLISGQFKWQDVIEEYNEDLVDHCQ